MNGRRLMALLVAAAALVAAGCGGSDNNEASGSTDTTTVTETAASTETTSATGTAAASGDILSGECKELGQLGEKFSQSLSGEGDLQEVAEAFDQLAGKVPDEIKPDFQVLAENYKKIAAALQGVNVQSGKAPTAGQAAKLQAALASIDNKKLDAAVAHLEAWAKKTCGS